MAPGIRRAPPSFQRGAARVGEEAAARLVAAPGLLGVSVADFNPDRDPAGSDAVRVVDTLAALWA